MEESADCNDGQFNFHHFNEEYDFGIVNSHGERIRKRKSPGRKPNPPSISERKAQNRASQKAFREREQQRRHEQENMKSMYLEEIDRLKQRVNVLEYEVNYLRGWMLQFTLSSIIENGTVADIWAASREFFSTETLETDEKNPLPFALDSLLKDNRVVGLNNAIRTRSPKHWNGRKPREDSPLGPEISLDPDIANINRIGMKIACPTNRPEDLTESSVCKLKPVIGTITSAPSLKTAADLAHMPPLQALQILRLQLKIHSLWNDNRKYTLIPTELQRNVPHDARIDYITGSSARDRLIIFQDYYDMDECFEYYSRNAQFIGGSMYDSRNWIVTNGFPERYWFLSHEVVEDYFLNRHWKIPRDLMLMPQSYDPSFKESENGSMLLDNPKLY